MQTSPLWDAIRAEGRVEGRVEGRRETILHLGRHKFGRSPTKKQLRTLEAITNLGQLEAMAARLLAVDSWAELLDDVQ
jgi:hypothetical protein